MFEKQAKEYAERTKTEKEIEVLNTVHDWGQESLSPDERRLFEGIQDRKEAREQGFQKGAEFGYNKANEEAMMKLKDEGIVKPLKDSILRNQRLSSQEQQELCAWIECAMDFGEKLDECAEKLAGAERTKDSLRLLGFPTFQSCKEYADRQLTKATEIIKKLYAVYYDPCVTESDLKYRDELFAEIKQFLNSEVEK